MKDPQDARIVYKLQKHGRRSPARNAVLRCLVISIVLFALSLFCSNPLTPGRHDGGLFILLHGWREFRAIGVVGPFVAVTWFANLAVPVAWLTTLMRLYMVAVTAGVVGLALSLAYLLGTRVAHSSIDAPQAIQIGVAYWVWVGSFAAVLAGALIGRLYDL